MAEVTESGVPRPVYREWFDHQHQGELDRLDGLAKLYDPASTSVLDTLGIEPQWRCLDAGCGRGTIAGWIAQRAHQGETIACDLDMSLFDRQPSPALRPMACDIGEADFRPESFDLIHARLLLQHLPNREQVLDRMVSWLAPGGWLVVADAFDLAATSTVHPEYAAFHGAVYEKLAAGNQTRPDWGRGKTA